MSFTGNASVENTGWTLCAMVPRTVVLEQVDAMDASFRKVLLVYLMIGILLIAAAAFVTTRFTKSITNEIGDVTNRNE